MKKLLIVLLLIMLVVPGLASAFNWNNNLTSYYKFDEGTGTSASDQTGLVNLTLSNSWITNGILNGARNLSVVSGYNKTNLSFTGSPGITYNFWILRNGNLKPNDFIFFQSLTQNPTVNGDYRVMADDAATTSAGFEIDIRDSAVRNTTMNMTTGIPLNLWTMVTLKVNSSTVEFWKNAVLDVSYPLNGFAFNKANLSYFQDNTNAPTGLSNASIDELGVFNRTLNSSEISEIYNLGFALPYNSQPYIPPVIKINDIYNASTYETSLESFITNVSTNNVNISSASLVYDGVSYTGSVSNYTLTNYTLTANNVGIPLISGTSNKNFFWNVQLSNGTTFSLMPQSATQKVSNINLTLCGAAPQDIRYINFTFKNETVGQEVVKAAVPSSTFNYWLGNGNIFRTLSFTNVSESLSYAFCFSPQNKTVNTNVSLTYSNSYSQQRQFNSNSLILTNTTTNLPLFLLPTSSGQQVSFQVQTVGGSRISGAIVNASRSGYGLVESRTTDDSGIVTMFLDPTAIYTINAFKQGYPISVLTLTPTQTSYTIVLGSNATTVVDYSRGITYYTAPVQTELTNDTAYVFNFTISSTYSGLTSYGFILKDYYGNSLASASGSNTAGGSAATSFNTGNYSFIRMNYFWVINGTYNNGSTSWVVVNTADEGWSIGNFFTDLRVYLNDSTDSDGLFGLKVGTSSGDFSLAIIIFVSIFAFAGIMSYKYGLTSSGAILGILFTGVLLFDVGLGIVPNPIGAIPHFPTFFMAIILVGEIIREAIT